MIFIKKTIFSFIVLYSFISCGTEDIAGNVLTGGLYGVAKGVSNISDPCKLGLSSCKNGNEIPNIKEVNTTVYIDPKDLNTTPVLVAETTDITMNVGEKINIFLAVSDQDLDEVNITAIAKKPSIASVEVLEIPDRLLITALSPGTTFIQAYGRDDDEHIGRSQKINVRVLGEDGNDTSAEKYSVTFSKDKIVMTTRNVAKIGYTVQGLQVDYTIKKTLSSTGANLIDVNESKSSKSIEIYSNSREGATVVSFTFTDSSGNIVIKDLQVEVSNSSANPPADPNLTSHTVRDTEACKNTNVWKQLINSYSVAERTIDSLNSLTFQSLSTATTNITLYYKDMADNTIQTRPDDAMDIKVDTVPRLDGTIETNRGFIIQTSKVFFNAGYYYVKIEEDCYRGEFPASDSVKNFDIYKSVKLVIN